MIVLGIDPGYAIVGFGVLCVAQGNTSLIRCGVIQTSAGVPMARRLYQIAVDLEEIIVQFQPDEMAVEELFFNTNVTTAIGVAQARGVILATAEKMGVGVFEYTPLQVKQAVVGYGRAEKKQVMDMTKRLLHLKTVPKPDDAADAVAIGLCHARSASSRLRDLEVRSHH
ncbi:MAG: crossover junction endodeoxyribonuclease RuvC [Evtepia sp.]